MRPVLGRIARTAVLLAGLVVPAACIQVGSGGAPALSTVHAFDQAAIPAAAWSSQSGLIRSRSIES